MAGAISKADSSVGAHLLPTSHHATTLGSKVDDEARDLHIKGKDYHSKILQQKLPEKRLRVKGTVMLKLPVPVSHADVVAAVRGGALQQIFIYRKINYVDVSFVKPEEALAFLNWTIDGPFSVAGHPVSTLALADL